MEWKSILIILYLVILALVCLRILFETQSTSKTLAYLMLCLFVPVFGILFYVTFGINYWRNKKYGKKIELDRKLTSNIQDKIKNYNEVSLNSDDPSIRENAELASMLIRDLNSPLTRSNTVKVLVNGEQKFPELLEAMKQAKHHIHIEYYIYEYDDIGTQIVDILIAKAKEGVEVRFIYDDFGSPAIKKKLEKRMSEAGIQVHPFHKVLFYLLANRLNYRNHRKVVIIDGKIAFTGGINVCDKYINNGKHKLFWRDTHVRIDGPAVYYLQFLFIADWTFCCTDELITGPVYFPGNIQTKDNCFVQVAAGGPDSKHPSVLLSILQAIYLAKKEILITTPYFIPGDSIMDALIAASLSGLEVKLLVPGKGDSRLVNAAAKSYYSRLLDAGVEIYLYTKGFVHAKTIVTDGQLSIIGTANMDYRSFELNFEVNVIVYDEDTGGKLRDVFYEDLEVSEKLDKEKWLTRIWYQELPEKIARLFSPVL